MSIHRILLALLFCTAIVQAKSPRPSPTPAPATPAPPSATPTPETKAAMEALRKPYDAALANLATENQKAQVGVDAWYLPGLEKLQDQIAKTGDLDGAVAVKNERSRITAHEKTSAEQIQAMPAALRTLRGQYDASLKKIDDQIEQRKAEEGRKYLTALEALQTRITKTGDIEQALLVKAERDRITASLPASAPKIAAAPETKASTGTPPATPKDLSKNDDPTSILVGQWLYTDEQTGARSTRKFTADGTMIAEGFKIPGHWKVVGNTIVIMYPNGPREDMHLPLNPTGTRVYAARGRVFKAVKLSD